MATLRLSESRRMVVPIEAAVDAVLQLDWERGGWLAGAPLTEARIETGENPGLVLCVRRSGDLQPQTCRYSLPAVAAAIIHLCWKAKIPLPKHWAKRIEIVLEGFEFTLEGTMEVQRHHGPLPEARGADGVQGAGGDKGAVTGEGAGGGKASEPPPQTGKGAAPVAGEPEAVAAA